MCGITDEVIIVFRETFTRPFSPKTGPGTIRKRGPLLGVETGGGGTASPIKY